MDKQQEQELKSLLSDLISEVIPFYLRAEGYKKRLNKCFDLKLESKQETKEIKEVKEIKVDKQKQTSKQKNKSKSKSN